MGQKFTYSQLVFGSIAFKLFNLGQTFRVAFHKLPTISWVNFGPFLLAHTLFFGSALKCSPNAPIPWLCCPYAILPQLWKCTWSHCPFGRPIYDHALTSWLMSWDVASIYPHTFPVSWCHLFCEVQQYLLQQSIPTTWCCHPHASQLGWCSLACKLPLFSSKHNNGHYGQTVLFLLQQTRGHFSKMWPFRLCRYRTRFTVDIDTFVPVSSSIFTTSFTVVLWLICTFPTKVRSSLGDRTRFLPEGYDSCVVPWCLYLRTIVCTDERGTFRRLECSVGWTWLVEVYNPFSEVLSDFFWFSHDVKQRGTEFEGRPWNTSPGTPPIDSNDVN